MTNAKRYFAHVRRNEDGSCAIHRLEDHVRVVGGMTQCAIARRDPVQEKYREEKVMSVYGWTVIKEVSFLVYAREGSYADD
ncbi:MAG: hypothetical protein A4E19_02195 [Nitrospira sp. SG-bin1]|nr:MAG: hypothetical protein A4E19_02195 [Nitrospira sp. SG-bin1]